MHLTIAMLTYRRNDYLAQVIPELLAQADDVSDARTTVSVLIVEYFPALIMSNLTVTRFFCTLMLL